MIGGREVQLARQALTDIVYEALKRNQEAESGEAERLMLEFTSALDKVVLYAMLDEARRRHP